MPQPAPKIRLFVDAPLGQRANVPLRRDQANYLFAVMRLAAGDRVALFNGRDGEWVCEVEESGKRSGRLTCLEQLRPQTPAPDVWLLFAPLKKSRTDFVAEKAAEMGCARLLPVFTRYTNAVRVNRARLQAHAVEAAEQCGLLTVPDVAEPAPLVDRLADWPAKRRLMFCDESGAGAPAMEVLAAEGPGPWAVLIGPEGGFAPEEADRLRAMPWARPVSLGPRILRADTAAVAALAVLQATVGDWAVAASHAGAPA